MLKYFQRKGISHSISCRLFNFCCITFLKLKQKSFTLTLREFKAGQMGNSFPEDDRHFQASSFFRGDFLYNPSFQNIR